MTPKEIKQLKSLLDKAIIELDLGVREINVLKLSKNIINKH